MDKIIDNLYLGDLSGATDFFRLKQNGITHILQVAQGFKPMYTKDFKYKVIYVQDMPYVNLIKHFPTCIQFIKEGIQQGGVFVHCFAGVSRSSTCVIAYLMQEHNMNFYEAMSFVRQKRSIIFPNIGFQRQLIDFERQLRGLSNQYGNHKKHQKNLTQTPKKQENLINLNQKNANLTQHNHGFYQEQTEQRKAKSRVQSQNQMA